MRIAIITLYTKSWEQLSNIVFPVIVSYCSLHKYSYAQIMVDEPYDGYKKIEKALSYFGVDAADMIWMIDSDILITNQKIKIEEFIDNDHDFFICKDYNGINAGSFIVRKSEWSLNFLNYLLEQKVKEGMHCEQDAINTYMKEFSNDEKVKILTHPSINSYDYCLYPEIHPQTHEQGQWKEGDFVLHLPGISMDKRLDIFKNTPIIK